MDSCNLNLSEKKCKPCEGGVPPLSIDQIKKLLNNLDHWELGEDASHTKLIRKKFEFKNYYHTIAFVNAIAIIAHQENHHPDLRVSYNHCTVEFTTHAIKGLSENDFICAAKIEALLKI